MEREQKQQTIERFGKEFANVPSIVLADFRGVDVETVTAIRRDFRQNGCHYKVLKNTVARIAIKDTNVAPMAVLLRGPTALMWSDESPTAPAKLAVKHAKEIAHFKIKGGFFEGQVLDAKGVEALAKMPGKQELQASLLMTFMAAPTDFVRLMAAPPINFLYVLQARARAIGG